MDKKIQSKSHPSHYLIHKYWGRKAHNLVSSYIEHYTKKGDLVLDPFMGSGGVIIESKKIGRNSIGVDINPVTKLIVDGTINNIDIRIYQNYVDEICAKVKNVSDELYVTKCPDCGKDATLLNAIWSNNEIIRVKGECLKHKIFKKNSDKYDIELANKSNILKVKLLDEKNVFYPNDELFKFVKRNGKNRIDDLFSSRNLIIASLLLREIEKVKNIIFREQLLIAFTSMLPNISKMIPGDPISVGGKSGWQISKFWAPPVHTEKNAIKSFRARAAIVIKANIETKNIFKDSEYRVEIRSSENLDFIKNDSVDYIFTDPPYGDSIAYLALSMFWNSWLRHNVDYESEIIYDTFRGKNEKDYSIRLDRVFSECYRVLKPNKYLSFTFHNRHVKFWKIVIDAVTKNNFEMVDVVWQPQAVSSGTQGINRKNTLKGDFVYTFVKSTKNKNKLLPNDSNGEKIVISCMEKLLKEKAYVDTTTFYELIIPKIVKNRAFIDNSGKILDIDKVLSVNFDYMQVIDSFEGHHAWQQKI